MMMELTPCVDFTNILALLFCAHRMRSFFWQTLFGHFSTQFGSNFVGELERKFFCQTLMAGNFSTGAEGLVKLTP